MTERQWKKLADLRDIDEGTPRSIRAGRMEFLAVRRGEEVHVCTNRCPHDGGRLSDGLAVGREVICPKHGARFSLETGRMLSPPALNDIVRFTVKVENGEVLVGGAIPAAAPLKPRNTNGKDICIVIAGGGAAGNACAENLRREGFDGRIIILTNEPDLPCNRPALSKDFLAGQTPPEALSLRNGDFYMSQRIEVFTNHRITAMDPKAKTVACSGGTKLHYDKLLLATGGEPKMPGIPGEKLPGCFRLRSRADGILLAEAAQKASRAVVVGSGFIGMEAAASLRNRGIDVTVITRGPAPLRRVFGSTIASRLRSHHESHGVRFVHKGQVVEVQGLPHSQDRRVVLDDGTELDADIVLFAVGISPSISFLSGTSLVQDGGVPVDSRLATVDPSIFAAGDIALAPYGAAATLSRVEHWAVAERQGHAAARAMLDDAEIGSPEPPFFWTEQYGLTFKAVGFIGVDFSIVFRGSPEEGDFLAGYYRGDTLMGAAALGFDKELFTMGELLKEQRNVPPGFFESESELPGLE